MVWFITKVRMTATLGMVISAFPPAINVQGPSILLSSAAAKAERASATLLSKAASSALFDPNFGVSYGGALGGA